MSIFKSEHDGMDLPSVWCNFTSDQKMLVIRHLNGHSGFLTLPTRWLYELSTAERRRVRRHLEMVGSVKVREIPRMTTNTGRTTYQQCAVKFRHGDDPHKAGMGVNPSPLHVMAMDCIVKDMQHGGLYIDMSKIEQRLADGMLYAKPNGGNRMLPSLYGQLRTYWVRGSGQKQVIATMNEGHLDNTLKLLKESHGNVVGKSAVLLGKMHRHFQNQPKIRAKLEELLKLIEKVEVDQMYPIFGTLAQELASRKEEVSVDLEWDDILKDW